MRLSEMPLSKEVHQEKEAAEVRRRFAACRLRGCKTIISLAPDPLDGPIVDHNGDRRSFPHSMEIFPEPMWDRIQDWLSEQHDKETLA